jgi:hypothetical protein
VTNKKYIKMLLIAGFVCVTLGGFLLHTRIHPVTARAVNSIPFMTGLVSLLVFTVMFSVRSLVPYAYVLNGMFVLIGTITMSHFSLHRWPKVVTLRSVFLETMLADIFILWTSLFIGKLIFELELTGPESIQKTRPGGRFLRYPNMGYWGVHLAGLSVVYILGHYLWK